MSNKIYAQPQGESLLAFLGALIFILSIVGAFFANNTFGPVVAIACFLQGAVFFALLKGFSSVITLLKFIAAQVDREPIETASTDPSDEYRPPQ